MSDPVVKAEKSKVKDFRQGKPQKECLRSKSKKDKPIKVEYRWNHPILSDKKWATWGKYSNIEIAEKVINDSMRKCNGHFEMRIKQ